MDKIIKFLNEYSKEISVILIAISIVITIMFLREIYKNFKKHKNLSQIVIGKYNNLINDFEKDKQDNTKINEKGEILNIENETINEIVENFKKSVKKGTENINTEVIIQKSLGYDLIENEKQLKLLPSISISYGLLGTFVGLTLTIIGSIIALNSNMSDYTNFALAMSDPFMSMSTAFITSIVGIACSIRLNKENTKIEKVKEKFYDLIEDYLDNTIYALYAENFMKNLTTELTEEMKHLFQNGVEELVGKINKNTIDLTDMVRAMNDSTKDLNRLSLSLSNAVENFRKPVQSFKESTDNFINTFENASNSMRDSVNKFGINVDKLEDKISQMNNILDINKTKMEDIATSIEESSETMKKSYDSVENTMENINEKQIKSMENFQEKLKNLNEISGQLSKSLGEFTQGFKDTQELTAENIADIINSRLLEMKSEIIKDISSSIKDVNQTIAILDEKTNKVSEQTRVSVDFFKHINNQLKDNEIQDDIVKKAISEKVANELNENLDQINIKLNDYMEYTKEKIDESLNKLDISVENTKFNLEDSIREVKESTDCIRKETDKINQVTNNVNKLIENNNKNNQIE